MEPLVYALKNKIEGVRMTSASGGAYSAISDFALNSGYTLYGAEFRKNFTVHHKGTTTETGRDKFKGSKYIQSELGKVFKEICSGLGNDSEVLFTGTPCQVAGLKKYLEIAKVKCDKLILNDIICHGVPSPLLWNHYLKYIQKKSKLKSYTFRFKEKGWSSYNIKVEFMNGKNKINTPKLKIYANIFSSDMALRPSCYHCIFSNFFRPSDITIGDFWGVEKSLPKLDDNKGVSLVLINTIKGQDIFEKIKENIDFVQSNTKDCIQHNLKEPTFCPTKREQFWDDYQRFGFEFIAKKYAGYSIKERLKRLIIIVLKKLGIFYLVRRLLGKVDS